MGCRGVHFALTPEEADRLRSAPDDEGLMAAIEAIEERWDRDWLLETGKAWDAIHRCLTDGTLAYGPTPPQKCILGEENLHDGDDYIVNLLEPDEVKEVAAAIRVFDEPTLRRSYFAIDPDDSDSPLSEEDLGCTWENFRDRREFFEKSSNNDRAVGFKVDR